MLFSIQSSSKQAPEESTGSLAAHSPSSSSSSSLHLSQKNDSATSPQKPRRIQYWPLFGQFLLAIFPALFIALAATVITLHRQRISKVGDIAGKAIFISPTVFPIVFAAIIGKLLRAIALFWSERGIKLGTLERLVGSQSFFSAVERQVLLRGQYALGIFLIILWALSPLGGQAALRLLSTSPHIVYSNETIRYLPIATMRESAYAVGHWGGQGPQVYWSSFASIYMTSLTTSRQYRNSAKDMFGNVKIPSLNSLSLPSNDSWIAIDRNQEVPYSSLLGIPVVGIPATGNVSFEIVSRYFSIECYNFYHKTDPAYFTKTFTGRFLWSRGASFYASAEVSITDPVPEDIVVPFNISSILDALGKTFQGFDCRLRPHDVESSVSCVDQSCQVTAMRSLPFDRSSWSTDSFLALRTFFSQIPLATIGSFSGAGGVRQGSSLTEAWLEKPYTAYKATVDEVYANWSAVQLPQFSRNLELVVNTLWEASYAFNYRYGNLSTNMSLYDNFENENGTDWEGGTLLDFNTTHTINSMKDGEEYRCNMTFAALLIVISALLLMCEITSIVLRALTLAPDILGYVSSFTRDNLYAETDQPSHSDGLDRTRALRDIKVMLGDVNPQGATGHITFTTMNGAERLNKDRLYD